MVKLTLVILSTSSSSSSRALSKNKVNDNMPFAKLFLEFFLNLT